MNTQTQEDGAKYQHVLREVIKMTELKHKMTELEVKQNEV